MSDDVDLPIKSWRNKNPSDTKPITHDDPEKKSHDVNGGGGGGAGDSDANNNGPFPQQSESNNHQNSQTNNTIKSTDEPFGISVYILLISTLAVIVLFLNYYRKGRNRTRRKYFLLNKLGL